MKVITSKPVIINGRIAREGFSNALGTSESEIMAFQQYAKGRGADLGKSGKNKDGVDGIAGSKTKAAYAKYGSDYEKLSAKPAETTTATTPTSTSGTTSEDKSGGWLDSVAKVFGVGTTREATEAEKKAAGITPAAGKDSVVSKKKRISTLGWVGIGAGILILGVGIYFLAKPKNTK